MPRLNDPASGIDNQRLWLSRPEAGSFSLSNAHNIGPLVMTNAKQQGPV